MTLYEALEMALGEKCEAEIRLLFIQDKARRYEAALKHIATMECFTREGEEPAHIVMQRVAENALKPDYYRGDGNTCSYCGSLSPDVFMNRLEAGDVALGTTTKSYKAYVHNHGGAPFIQAFRDCPRGSGCSGPNDCTHWTTREQQRAKFYFMHLSLEQRKRFGELLTARQIRFAWGSPLPYFCVPAPSEET